MRRVKNVLVACTCLVLAACGGTKKPPPPVATPAPAPSRGAPNETKYKVGDFVVYRFSGAYSEKPVEMREEVIEIKGNRLAIDVKATRGRETRHWIQVVTDTEENQRKSIVDELYVVRPDGTRQRIPNEQNAGLIRLYEWVLVMASGRGQERITEPCKVTFLDKTFDCLCEKSTHTWRARTIKSEDRRCKDFLWTNAPSRWWDPASDEDVWKVEVLDASR
jgi:hypothetical protein